MVMNNGHENKLYCLMRKRKLNQETKSIFPYINYKLNSKARIVILVEPTDLRNRYHYFCQS